MLDSEIILLAEDNENDVFLFQTVFRDVGLSNRLAVVHDGEQAIDYLQGTGAYANRARHPLPLLTVLDLNMPRKGGLEVLDWLRRQPALKRMPAYIMSASNRPEDVEAAYESGANAYIVKPGSLDGLTEMVRAWRSLSQFQAFPNVTPC